jgi:hypothetical protein
LSKQVPSFTAILYNLPKVVGIRSNHINSAKAEAVQQNSREWISSLLRYNIDG